MKVVIVILAVILVLFLIGIGVGARQEQGDSDVGREGLADWLRDKLQGPAHPVLPVEVVGCREDQGLLVTVGQTCLATVEKSSAFARELRLVSVSGQAEVTFSQPRGLRIKRSLPDEGGDADLEFNVGRDGASMIVTCSSIEPCFLAIATD